MALRPSVAPPRYCEAPMSFHHHNQRHRYRRNQLRDVVVVVALAMLACALAHTAPAGLRSVVSAAQARQTLTGPSIVVFGATGGGFAAAIAAARTNPDANVTLIGAKNGGGLSGARIGGMLTGGLQHTDCGNASALGGVTWEYFVRVEHQYPNRSANPYLKPETGPPCWMFEAHVAEAVMWEMLREDGVRVVTDAIGVASVGVSPQHGHRVGALTRSPAPQAEEAVPDAGAPVVRSLTTMDGSYFEADVWIDASYEGDLLAAAGATMTAGRESKAQYGEKGAGVQPATSRSQIAGMVNPYWPNSTDPLPFVTAVPPGAVGSADSRVQAYTFRMCMTRSPANRVPITAPPTGYNATHMELFRRAGVHSVVNCLGPVPHNYSDCSDSGGHGDWCKCDMIGGGGLQTDFAGGSYAYPAASVAARQRITAAHVHYVWAVLWFGMNDPSVPAGDRAALSQYGLCRDEFADSDPPYWPHQLYVREARRLVGDWVFTQLEPDAARLNTSIGLGSYSFDSHTVETYIENPRTPSAAAKTEGNIADQQAPLRQRHRSAATAATAPAADEDGGLGFFTLPLYEIPYATLLPKRAELSNVLAAVPVSASHVRFNSLRMEPTWMVMGHAAGTAASMAATTGAAVHDVNVTELQAALVAQQQIVWPSQARHLPPP